MKKILKKYSWAQRAIALTLAVLLVAGYFPTAAVAADGDPGTIKTVADPSTLTRPDLIYGENTRNAGKVTVGKSVTDGTLTLPEGELPAGTSVTPEKNNFLVTVSQSAQVMGLATETSVPVDVVFVLDTSGSMTNNSRDSLMVTAANNAINTLMQNPLNRVGVVAFSASTTANNNRAATVLSPLDNYTGTAASSHLTYTSGGWNSNPRITGRGANAGTRQVTGGTNIQAGVALGAKMLLDVAAADTYITDDNGNKTTRMPFIIVLSDGSPTFSMYSDTWYSSTLNLDDQDGSGDTPYAGNGFLAALTAAYYKGAVTEHYYGTSASEENRCYVYSLGVQLDSLSTQNNERALARITMDPDAYFKTGSSNAWYNTFNTYWNGYTAGNAFSITVNGRVTNYSNNRYTRTIPVTTINATKNYVNGISSAGKAMYTGGLAYNDDYYNATNTSDINGIFDKVVSEIQKKAISSPTHVNDHGADFSGYVTFTDPLGEYMEVKDMKGIVTNGTFFQGASAARHLSAYGQTGNTNNDPEFDALLKQVMQKRLSMTASQSTDAFITAFANAAIASENQAWWRSNTEFDNSIVWWGNSYPTNEEDESVQILGFAENDTVEYIEKAKVEDAKTETTADNIIPADADYVCRSYFFYGTAGDTVANLDYEYLYFVVRVQRELTAPYKQTVVISAPASLLSVSEVFITEETDDNGDKVYSAEVTHENPARVIYEVGLRSDINPQNVEQKIAESYKNEQVNGEGSVNYDPQTDTYNFFTNDWDRTIDPDDEHGHHRAMAKATFDAAADNAFYTYQQNTTITDATGVAYKGDTQPTGTWYYVRQVYDWSNATYNSDTGVYEGVDTYDAYIKIQLESDAGIRRAADGSWYIPKGVYAASTLQVNGDDAMKSSNDTNTAFAASHPHRTGSATNSHYTVLLGNNGMLSLVSDPPKKVSITPANGNVITNGNGETVMVGDKLTYTIKVVNNESTATTAVVTDTVPKGTKFVSATPNVTPDASGKLTWSNVAVPANGFTEVSFVVEVLPSAIAGANDVTTIDNTAVIDLANAPAYTTNTTTNPPQGKKVAHENGNEIGENETLKVGDVLTYYVRAYNDTDAKAEVVVTDIIPAGTTYVPGTADHNGVYNEATKTITWTFADNTASGGLDTRLEPGNSVVVSFDVVINASAKVESDGQIHISNDATIKIGSNGPTIDTNSTDTKVKTGNITLTKTVAAGSTGEEFTLRLTEATGTLDGEYTVTSSLSGVAASLVDFVNGTGTVTIHHGETLTIEGLPEGAVIDVVEDTNPGWTPEYSGNTPKVGSSVTVVSGNNPNGATVTNTYYAQPAHFQLKGTKTFVGSSFPAGNYTFNAVQVNADGSVLSGSTTPITVSATVVHDGYDAEKQNPVKSVEFAFTERSFGTAFTGTDARYYLITEESVNIPGVITSAKQYLLKLEVEDDGNGQLVAKTWLQSRVGTGTAWASWSDTDHAFDWANEKVTFTNIYPDAAQATIQGTKMLNGRYIKDKEFTFELLQTDENFTNGKVIATNVLAANETSNEATFKFDLDYTAEDMAGASSKTFYYQVREVKGTNTAIVYDADVYNVAITVTLNAATGELEAGAPVITMGGSSANIVFENTFNSPGTSLNLSGTKTLNLATGVEGNRTLRDGEFSFSIYPADSSYQKTSTTEVAGGSNAADGKITFGAISYTAADMIVVDSQGHKSFAAEKRFYYVIEEDKPAISAPTFDPNMVYSTETYNVEVKVTYNSATGEMTATVVSAEGLNGYSFTNTQNPAYVTFEPTAQKTTTMGNTTGDLPAGLKFSFKVMSIKAPVENAGGTLTWDKDAQGSIIDEEGTGTSAATETKSPVGGAAASDTKGISFTHLRVDYADWVQKQQNGEAVYWYAIMESNTAAGATTGNPGNGVKYDESIYLMKVVVTHSGNQLQAAAPVYYELQSGNVWQQVATGVMFENTYDAQTHINLSASKSLTGRNLKANEFDFKLQRLTENSGQFTVVSGSEIDGRNTYDAQAGNFANVEFGSLNYSAEMVTVLVDEQNNVKKYCNDFYYLMTETKPTTAALAGVEYDPSAYIVKITVEKTVDTTGSTQVTMDADLAGVWNATPNADGSYGLGSEINGWTNDDVSNLGNTGASFTNKYTPTGTSATISVTKRLDGRTLKPSEFTFELYRVDGTNEYLAGVVTNTTAASDNVVFTRNYNASNLSSLAFNNGEFVVTYRLTERTPTQGGVTKVTSNDYWIQVTIKQDTTKATYHVTSIKYFAEDPRNSGVTATYAEFFKLDNDGKVDLDRAEGAKENLVFVNNYTTNNAYYVPVANKTLLGANDVPKDMTPGQFSFTVEEVNLDGSPKGTGTVAAGANKADGTVEFGRLTFSNISVNEGDHDHYYKIKEDKGSEKGITYDDKAYYLKVTIHDNGQGKLTVKKAEYYSDAFSTKIAEAADTNANGEIEANEHTGTQQILFTNHYGPSYLTIKPSTMQKMVEVKNNPGQIYELSGSEFNFDLYKKGAGDWELGTWVSSGTNGASVNGVAPIDFQSITFTSEQVRDGVTPVNGKYTKVFTYIAVERDWEANANLGFVKDGKQIKITITVTDDGYGNLTATIDSNGDGVVDITDGEGNSVMQLVYSPTSTRQILRNWN